MGVLEDAGCGQRIIRYSFIVFNVIFTIIGLGLVVTGSYAIGKSKTNDFNEILDLLPPAIQTVNTVEAVRGSLLALSVLVLLTGLITMVISSCGWLGACKQNTCMLFTFSVSMVVIVVLEFIFGISILVIAKKISSSDPATPDNWKEKLIKQADDAYLGKEKDSDSSKAIVAAWDLAQGEGECCGWDGKSDWRNPKFAPYFANRTAPPYPTSCLYDSNKVYDIGCFEAISSVIKSASISLGGVAIAFCLIEIFGVAISCYLACSMKKGVEYVQH